MIKELGCLSQRYKNLMHRTNTIIFMDAQAPEALTYARKKLSEMDNGFGKFGMINLYADYLEKLPENQQLEGIEPLKDIAAGSAPWWLRMGAYRACFNFKKLDGMADWLQERKGKEDNEQLLNMINSELESMTEEEELEMAMEL